MKDWFMATICIKGQDPVPLAFSTYSERKDWLESTLDALDTTEAIVTVWDENKSK